MFAWPYVPMVWRNQGTCLLFCMVLSNQGPMCLGTQPHKILSDNGPIFPRSYDGMVLHNQGPDKPGLSVPRVLSQQVMYIGC